MAAQVQSWLIAVVVAMAAFMEVLDTSIANVALPYLAGGLAASNSQSTWVLTSYLAANAVVLPISGWLAVRFGRKRFFIFCILLFTLSSMLCGSAPSLGMLICSALSREPVAGGCSRWRRRFSPTRFRLKSAGWLSRCTESRPCWRPDWPGLGGWITFSYSWRWIFYINLPVGILAVFLVFPPCGGSAIHRTTVERGVRLDYIGLGFLAVESALCRWCSIRDRRTIGSVRVSSSLFSAIAAVCLIGLVAWEWFHREPIIDLRLFKNFNFATANLMMFMLGIVYFSSLVLMPQLLQTLMGYTAELAGLGSFRERNRTVDRYADRGPA